MEQKENIIDELVARWRREGVPERKIKFMVESGFAKNFPARVIQKNRDAMDTLAGRNEHERNRLHQKMDKRVQGPTCTCSLDYKREDSHWQKQSYDAGDRFDNPTLNVRGCEVHTLIHDLSCPLAIIFQNKTIKHRAAVEKHLNTDAEYQRKRRAALRDKMINAHEDRNL